MAAAARKRSDIASPKTAFKSRLAEAGDDAVAVESPALALQHTVQLAYEHDLAEPHVEKWPPAARLILLTCLTVTTWAGLIAGARALLHG